MINILYVSCISCIEPYIYIYLLSYIYIHYGHYWPLYSYVCVLEVRVQNLGGQGCVTVDVADLQFVAILAFEVHTIGWSCKVKRYYFINVTYQLRQKWRFGLVVWSWQYGLLCVCVFSFFQFIS